MPAYIDPRWEFWEPDPEVAEALEGGPAAGLGAVLDARLCKAGAQGLRFGRGDPDGFWGRLAPERPSRRPEPARHRECAACGAWFPPACRGRRYCSLACRPAPPRRLPDVACAHCGLPFRPSEHRQRYCSLRCVGLSQRREDAPAGCRHCGGPLPPSRSLNQAQPRLYCSGACGSAARARRARRMRRAQEGAS